jgi:hypothetical protein
VTVSDGQGHSAITDANGNYLLEGLPPGVFSLFPVKPNYIFNPPTRTVNLPPDASNMDFSADLDLAGCSEAITNGGFESKNVAWSRAGGWPADWSKNRVHIGVFSMRTGILSSADNQTADSSAYQQVTLPAGTQSASLRFWIYQESGDSAGDRQEVVLNSSLAGPSPTVLLSELKNTKAWVFKELALPVSFFGKTVWVGFATHNDGNSGVTVMYVDDVSLQVCR